MKELRGRTVLITGAGGGFGQQLTRQFIAAGSQIIISDVRQDALGAALQAAAHAARGTAAPGTIIGTIAADLASADGATALHAACERIAPRLDILVNNAGLGVSGVISDVPPAVWERLMQVNLLAPMRLTAAFLPGMIAQRSGHIVNIASVAGLVGAPGLSVYCAAKFGLRGFGEALAADVERYGIDVTTLYPFFARTAILDSPHFGPQRGSVPEHLLSAPDAVIAELMRGIVRRQRHVYPGRIPKLIEGLRRYAPGLLRYVG